MANEDQFIISRTVLEDMLHCIRIMVDIVDKKPVTEGELDKLKYANRLIKNAMNQFDIDLKK